MVKRTWFVVTLIICFALSAAAEHGSKPDVRWDITAKAVSGTMFGLQVTDLVITKQAFSIGAEEANPVMAPLLSHEPAGSILKLGVAAGSAYVIHRAIRDPRKSVRWTGVIGGAALIGLYVWTVRHNVGVVHDLKNIQRGEAVR